MESQQEVITNLEKEGYIPYLVFLSNPETRKSVFTLSQDYFPPMIDILWNFVSLYAVLEAKYSEDDRLGLEKETKDLFLKFMDQRHDREAEKRE